jgi:uncharacterized protein involved in exopolysaccharide biosynthesis
MEQEFSLSQYLALLRRRWRTIAITLAVTLLAAVVFSLVQPVSYKGEAVLVAQPPKYAWRLDTSFQTIFEDLRLDRRSDYTVLVTDKTLGQAMAAAVIEKLGDALPPALRDPARLKRQVNVKNGQGRLLYLNVTAPTAELARDLTNAWAEVWVAEADARYGQGADQAKFAAELAQAQARLDAASAALREFRSRTGLALGMGGYMAALGDGTLAAGMPLLQQQLVLNNSQLADYRLALARVRMLRERAQEAQAKGEPFAVLPLEVLDTPLLVARGQLTRPAVEAMHGDIAQLLAALDVEEKALSASIARLEEETKAIQAELAAQLQEQSQLEREYALAEEAVRALQRKVTEIPIQQEVVGPPLTVLSRAVLPQEPATPNWLLNLAAGALLGLLGGIMLALGWEFARGTA